MALTRIICAGVGEVEGVQAGTLDTSAMTAGEYTIAVRVTALGLGLHAVIAIEDTASSDAFSDADKVAIFQFKGRGLGEPAETRSVDAFSAPMRYGVPFTALRANVLKLSPGAGLEFTASLVLEPA